MLSCLKVGRIYKLETFSQTAFRSDEYKNITRLAKLISKHKNIYRFQTNNYTEAFTIRTFGIDWRIKK